jgi:hypothetical protein
MNEPDSRECPEWIEVADYINLVRRAVPVIRQEYPDAKIIVGSTGLLGIDCQNYLYAILQSDIMPIVDVVSWHPIYGASPQYDNVRDYYYSYPFLVQRIFDVASAHGFRGEYSADEMTWRMPLNTLAEQPWTYNGNISAKYYARGIMMNLGMDVAAGVMIDYRLAIISSLVRNLNNIMAGTKPESLTVKIQSEATNTMSYSYSLPGDDRLFALWTNGAAVEHDPGISSSRTIPGFAGWKATGIDITYSFEQELITSNDNGNLIISNLLIKDYPVVIRLSKEGRKRIKVSPDRLLQFISPSSQPPHFCRLSGHLCSLVIGSQNIQRLQVQLILPSRLSSSTDPPPTPR